MKKSTLPVIVASAAAAHFGISYLTFHEIFDRNVNIPRIINETQKKMAKKKAPAAPSKKDPRVEWMHEQEFEEFTITNDRGQALKGFYLEAAEKSNKFVLCAHGYRNQGKGEFRFITKFYHDNGFNVFLVDHVAEGASEGDMISFGYYESKDMTIWINFLIKNFGEDIEIALHGISMGSATVVLLAGNEKLPENVKFMISDCGYSTLHGLFEDVLKVPAAVSAPLMRSVDFIHKKKTGFSYYDITPIDAVKNIKIPVFFVHGIADGFIPFRMCQELYGACQSEKDILLVEHAGHTASYRKNSEEYEKKILEFKEKYMNNTVAEV
ncbi:MAG: alpha/beta hydrolase [Clostridia bacterium]|nr:alpha/beta hydrolase [Clostridia bacterium]